MKLITFATIWTALYAVLVAAIACFIAWGVPDVTAWDAEDRAKFLFLAIPGALPWVAIGAGVWERIQWQR